MTGNNLIIQFKIHVITLKNFSTDRLLWPILKFYIVLMNRAIIPFIK